MANLKHRTDHIKTSLDRIVQEHQVIAFNEMAMLVVEYSRMGRDQINEFIERIQAAHTEDVQKNLPYSYDVDFKHKAAKALMGALFNTEFRDDLPQ